MIPFLRSLEKRFHICQVVISYPATDVLRQTFPQPEKAHMRICSEPNKSANDIYERLKYKKMPFRKIKIEKSL